MKAAVVDTDILSMFFRGDSAVVSHFDSYLREYDQVSISIITYYEVLSGLKHRDAQKQLAGFLDFSAHASILPLTVESATLAADIYASQRAKGSPVDDVDILIAGIALAHGRTLITHNTRHFGEIAGLEVEDWSLP